MSAFFNQNHPGQHVENSFTCTQIGKAMGFPSKSGHGTLLSRRSNLYFRFFLFVLLLPHLPCEGIVQCISHQLSQCMGNGWLVNRFWHFNQIQATHTHTDATMASGVWTRNPAATHARKMYAYEAGATNGVGTQQKKTKQQTFPSNMKSELETFTCCVCLHAGSVIFFLPTPFFIYLCWHTVTAPLTGATHASVTIDWQSRSGGKTPSMKFNGPVNCIKRTPNAFMHELNLSMCCVVNR